MSSRSREWTNAVEGRLEKTARAARVQARRWLSSAVAALGDDRGDEERNAQIVAAGSLDDLEGHAIWFRVAAGLECPTLLIFPEWKARVRVEFSVDGHHSLLTFQSWQFLSLGFPISATFTSGFREECLHLILFLLQRSIPVSQSLSLKRSSRIANDIRESPVTVVLRLQKLRCPIINRNDRGTN